MKKVLFGVFGLALASLAVAQGADGDTSVDFASWFTSPHALAGVVVGLVALLRKHFVNLDGVAVPGLALGLGVGLAFLGNLLGFLTGNWVFFGLQAGLEAVLVVSGVRAVLQPLSQKGGDSGTSTTATPPTPPPKAK
jgi:hypothetical protein